MAVKIWECHALLLLLGSLLATQHVAYGFSDQILRLSPTTEEQLEYLNKWIEKSYVDVWHEASLPSKHFDVHIKKGDLATVTAMLKTRAIQYTILVEDVDVLLNKEDVSKKNFAFSNGYDYSKYGTWEQIHKELQNLVKTYPKRASLFNVGKSYEGRDQIGIKVTKGDGQHRSVIWIDSGIHAREWIAPASIMFFINQLFTSKDKKILEVISKYDFHILPVFNIDGFVYTHLGRSERFWRKTRSKSGYVCIGTDPNRNWGNNFGGIGTSDYPCSSSYHGKYAFSEPEVQNVANYLANIRDLKSYWTVHAYGNMVLLPWSYTEELPKDYAEIKRVGDAFVEGVRKKHGTKYSIGSPAKILYPVAGGSIDWTYDTLGVTYSFALELRDKGKYGFVLPANQIIPCGEEVTQGFIEAFLTMK